MRVNNKVMIAGFRQYGAEVVEDETGETTQATKEVALTAVLSAAYAAAILLLVIPSPTGGYTHIGDFVVFAAALFFRLQGWKFCRSNRCRCSRSLHGISQMVCVNSSSLARRAGSRFGEKQAVCTAGCQLHDRGFSNGYNLLCGQHLRQGIGIGRCLLRKGLVRASRDLNCPSVDSCESREESVATVKVKGARKPQKEQKDVWPEQYLLNICL